MFGVFRVENLLVIFLFDQLDTVLEGFEAS